MEAFCSLAKHLRGGCAEGGDSANTIITAAVSPYSSDGEDGPYFDLEFTLPQDEEPTEKAQEDEENSGKPENGSSYAEDSDNEKEAKLLINSRVTRDGCTDQENVTTFNGELVSIESSSHVLQHDSDDQNCKFPVSVLKSAAKFGVVLLKLKKSKPERTENMPKTEGNHGETGRKFFAFRLESQNAENSEFQDQDRKSKQHYLKMVKPLYVRISKAYAGKLKFYGQLNLTGAEKGKDELLSGKSRSAAPSNKMACNRRDDSLLQVQDGIQGAILHCKTSFNASIDT